jgi:hypothetical protein
LSASSYWKSVCPFVEVFGKDAVLVVTTEELDMDPLTTLNRIDDFVGVARHAYTRGAVKRNTAATLALPNWLQRARWSRAGKVLHRVTDPRLRAKFRDAIASRPTQVTMDDRAIRADLETDLNRFITEFDVDTTNWSRWNSAKARS